MTKLLALALSCAAVVLFACGCAAAPEVGWEMSAQKTDDIQIKIGDLMTLQAKIPIPNSTNLPQPSRSTSREELDELKPSKSIYLLSRTWEKWRSDFSFGEAEIEMVITKYPTPKAIGDLDESELREYFQRKLGKDSIASIASINELEWVHYSIEPFQDEQTIRVASEVYVLPVGKEFYLQISYGFNDPTEKYTPEWMLGKRAEAKALMSMLIVNARKD